MGTNETKAASIQIAPMVATATYRVTQRVYLQFEGHETNENLVELTKDGKSFHAASTRKL